MRCGQLAGARVLVTGAGGLIGSRLTAVLAQMGARPRSVCKVDAYPQHIYREHFGIRTDAPDFVVGDIAAPGVAHEVVRDCDYVVHAAALADVAACTQRPLAAIEANIVGTQRVIEAVAATPSVRRMVFVSSASVYGNGAGDSEFGEEMPLQPVSVYGNSKAWGELQTATVLGEAGVSYTILRYFSVYGEPQVIKENSHSWVVAWFAMRAALGLPLLVNGGGGQVRDLVHVDDITAGTLRALVAPTAHDQAINIGTGTATTIRQVAELVRAHFPGVVLRNGPMPPGDPRGGRACTRRMEQVLGWRPQVTVAEGVARYVAWLDRTPSAIPNWLRQPTPV